MTVTVELAGLEFHGRHGLFEDERAEGQRFLFDVWLEVPDTASRSDRVEDAVDYRDVVAAVRRISDGRAYRLMEALAAAVADELMTSFPVTRVRVRVRKPDIRLDTPLDWPAVSVERVRS
jgi:7,8-dihydroneopterin aldolase/epimerase/oxygenase